MALRGNLATITGNLAAPPEFKFSAKGNAFITFRLGSSSRVQNRETGNWENGETTWYNVTAFGQAAENISNCNFDKGTILEVIGEIELNTYTHQATGESRSNIQVKAERVSVPLDVQVVSGIQKAFPNQGNRANNQQQGGYAPRPPATPQNAPQQGNAGFGSGFDDEQPF